MTNVPDTPLGRMYREHIEFILKKDIESLLDQYTDDALLISSFTKKPLYYRGRAQLREHQQGILGIKGLDTDIALWAETEAKLARLREITRPRPGEYVTNMARIAWERDPWEAAARAAKEGKPVIAYGPGMVGIPAGHG